MKKQRLLLFVFILLASFSLNAQRYLTAQFTTVSKTTAIYGDNFTVLSLSTAIGHSARASVFPVPPMAADIYQATGDTVSKRPLMIFVPTGNFLPKSSRSSPTGDRVDSVAVEMCTRFAKMGYVTASIDYRLGWNPFASTATDRTFQLINAAYRGIQDLRNAVRYFKVNAAALKIDTSRIMVIGDGTGGYITLGAATFNDYAKVYTTARPQGKFTAAINGMVVPMIIEQYNGNINGTSLGVWPGIPGIPIPAGDTLCVSNYASVSSKVQMAVNLGGAIGDYTWLDANSTPIVSIACPHDQNAPYRDSTLLVPIGNGQALPVVQVQGSHWVALRADSLGVNNSFKRIITSYDPYKSLVAPRSAGGYYGTDKYAATYATGLLPLIGRSKDDSAPWQWWNTDTTVQKNGDNAAALAGNPGMSATKARAYIDSIMTFISPRACMALNLPCAIQVTGTEDLLSAATTKLSIAPNPAQNYITFESEVYNPMQSIEIYDLSGRLVKQAKVNTNQFNMMRGSLPTGMYIAKVKFEGGILSKKIIFEDK